MSTRIMAACWPLKIPPTPKFVLIALADNANDAGFCWPSIDTICERTSFGRTAVIDAIRWLENAGFLSANRSNGRKTTYTVIAHNQSASRTGDGMQTSTADGPVASANQFAKRTGPRAGPVRETDGTSTAGGPVPVREADTNRHITVKEPSKRKARDACPPKPDVVTDSVWADFLSLRNAKRAPLTATALQRISSEAAKARISLDDALAMCCERGWQSFRADWLSVQEASRASAPKSSDWWLSLGYGDEALARRDGHKPGRTTAA